MPEPHWKGPYQLLLSTDTTVKLEGIKTWVHVSQLKAPPDIRSRTSTGDLQIKLTSQRSCQHQRRLLPSELLGQDFILY